MSRKRVTFLHPDLGIGGAERLVVDAALALKNKGFDVNFVTSHHDKSHCFKETKDGTLSVTVVGDWLPRSLFDRFYALFAYLRMFYAAVYLIFFSGMKPDVVFCDQVSVCVTVLRLRVKHIIFYCHFPDQLLSTPGSKLKALYRYPLNLFEELSTGDADKVLVNSKFTRKVFKDTFKSLSIVPDVLYPSINTKYFDTEEPVDLKDIVPSLSADNIVILSINRYERKKNIKLAISALLKLKDIIDTSLWDKVNLIIAGGYDKRVDENVQHYEELKQYAKENNLSDKIHFLKSPSDKEKLSLLLSCRLIVYTPSNEHFGIVPLEAMYAKKPVVAVNSGGPVETVVDKITGFLCEPTDYDFSKAISVLLNDENKATLMGSEGRKRFEQLFSFNAFSNQLVSVINDLLNKSKVD